MATEFLSTCSSNPMARSADRPRCDNAKLIDRLVVFVSCVGEISSENELKKGRLAPETECGQPNTSG